MNETFSAERERWGFRKALFALIMKTLRNRLGWHVAVLNVRDLDEHLAPPQAPAGYAVRVLSAADLRAAASQPALELGAGFTEKAQERGDYCAGAFYGDQLVAYVWRAYASTPVDDQLVLCFQPPLRYGYKALTLPEHRGLHLQSAIALFTDRRDCQAGHTQGLSYIETHNYPSLISDRRRGNVPVGKLYWISNSWLHLGYTSATARKLGIRLSKL